MVLEVAVLNVKKGLTTDFIKSFQVAENIIMSMQGYVSHELKQCIEDSDKFILLVNWKTLADHVDGFRNSEQYQEWKELLHHYYDPFPIVEHYKSC